MSKINCEWSYCKYNEMTGVCHKDNIALRCATSNDLATEGIIKEETQDTRDNAGNVLICASYECMR